MNCMLDGFGLARDQSWKMTLLIMDISGKTWALWETACGLEKSIEQYVT